MVVTFLFVSAAPVWAGDHAVAVESLKNRAAQGIAEAQYNLGVMYDNGQGVPQDATEAQKLTREGETP